MVHARVIPHLIEQCGSLLGAVGSKGALERRFYCVRRRDAPRLTPHSRLVTGHRLQEGVCWDTVCLGR
jgi:hypothetical protein